MTAFFTDADARYLASLGMNSVRIPFNYRHFEDDDRPLKLKAEGFALLDRAIGHCQRHGLYAVLDLHALPGAQNQHWHSDNGTHVAGFWVHRHFQDRAVHLWEALASRYRDNVTVAGYNIMNEPADPEGTAIRPFYDRVIDAIRAIDPGHVIFLDGNRYSTDFSAFEDVPVYPNTVYTAHDYALPGFVDGGPYPGVSRGVYVDRDVVEETFLRRTEFMRRTGTPIWIGELGPVYTGDQERDEPKYRLLRDQLDIYQRYGAGWAVWAYKDVGLQGLVSTAPGSPWSSASVTCWPKVPAGSRQLGHDRCRGPDVMAPIEAAFAREYPASTRSPSARPAGHDPGPVHPAGGADARGLRPCFAGVADEETARELADSFLLENCVVREQLAAVLSESARLLSSSETFSQTADDGHTMKAPSTESFSSASRPERVK